MNLVVWKKVEPKTEGKNTCNTQSSMEQIEWIGFDSARLVYGIFISSRLSHPPTVEHKNCSVLQIHRRQKTTIAIYGNFGLFRTNSNYTNALLRRSVHRMEIVISNWKRFAIYLIACTQSSTHTHGRVKAHVVQEPRDEGGGEESKWLVAEIHKCVRDILRFVVGVDVGILYSWFVMYSCGLYGRQIELQQMLEKRLHDKFTLANTITHMCNVFKVSYPLCSCVCSRTFFYVLIWWFFN